MPPVKQWLQIANTAIHLAAQWLNVNAADGGGDGINVSPFEHDRGIRLPSNFKPLIYDLAIWTDLKARTYVGAEVISIECVEKATEIIFHAGRNLDFSHFRLCLPNATLLEQDGHCHQVLPHHYERGSEKQTVTLRHPILAALEPKSILELEIRWKDNLSSVLNQGYAEGADIDLDEHSFSAATFFEPISARKAIPCWDEPSPKAQWKMSMLSRMETVNLGNMPPRSERTLSRGEQLSRVEALVTGEPGQDAFDGSWKSTRFDTTPPMAPYNFAWANGHFKKEMSSYWSSIRNQSVPTAIYVNSNTTNEHRFLLSAIDQCTPFFEEAFNTSFPMPKLDWLSASGRAGGMEHWGMIISAHEPTRWDEGKGAAGKSGILSFAAHEIAHQWFGNIVTMAWWDDIWLNEALASWATNELAIPRFDPDGELGASALIGKETSMALDATSSHPIIASIVEESQLLTSFDSITYDKGSSVIRMVDAILGRSAFLSGLSSYLKKYSYQSVGSDDLWDELQATSQNVDVWAFGRAWSTMSGVPVVSVARTSSEDGVTTWHLKQERFRGSGDLHSPSDQLWPIPLFIKPGEQVPCHPANDRPWTPMSIFVTRDIRLCTREDVSPQLVLNRDRAGYYRVQYDVEGFDWMKKNFITKSRYLSSTDRAAFLYDSIAFAKAGRLSTTKVLRMLDSVDFSTETSTEVWMASVDFIIQLYQLFLDRTDEIRSDLRRYVERTMGSTLDQVGIYEEANHTESASIKKIRQLVVQASAQVGTKDLVEQAKMVLHNIAGDTQTGNDVVKRLDDEVLSDILSAAVRYGGKHEWEAAFGLWNTESTSPLGMKLLAALATTPDRDMIQKTFVILDGAEIRNDFDRRLAVIQSLMLNPHARHEAISWALTNMEWFNSATSDLIRVGIISSVFSTLSSEKQLERLRDAMRKYPDTDKGFVTEYERIQNAINWLNRDGDLVSEWLRYK